MPGHLFTEYFLTEGIGATDEWRASVSDAAAFGEFRDGVRQRYDALSRSADPNEAVTEQELIRPALELLGWADYLPQQGAARNEDIPDLLLFPNAASKERAAARSSAEERYRDAIVVEESKRFGLALDARDSEDGRRSRTPHGQILRYLSTAEVESESRIRWGILTSGVVWRLYDYRARPRATGYFEADLGQMLESGREDRLRIFYLLFRRDSFILRRKARRPHFWTTPFWRVVATTRRSRRTFRAWSSRGSSRSSWRPWQPRPGEELPRVREAALIFLYRLLFVLYAEDRGLLPVNDSRYDDYGLRKRVRDDIAQRTASGDIFSAIASNYYDHLTTLCRLIDKGDASIGLPPYNGGLFAADGRSTAGVQSDCRTRRSPLIIYDLSHAEADGAALRQLPRHVGAAAWVDLRAPAGTGAGTGRNGEDRHPSQRLRAQGQRQLLHAPGACGPDRRPDAEAAGGGAARAAFEKRSKELKSDRRPSWRSGTPSCASWTRQRRCST